VQSFPNGSETNYVVHRVLTPQLLTTSLLAATSADSSAICARRNNECGGLRELAIERSCDCSA
jgi:hypothetical protein